MTKTYSQIQSEIARLQKEAEALKKKEVVAVISKIREAISFYGLTADDLGLAGPRTKRSPAAAQPRAQVRAKKKSKLPAKYRDDKGNEWSGHARRPRWYLDALASGKTPEDLAV